MKVIVAGSRDIVNPVVIGNAITQASFEISEVVSGGARGVDSVAEQWAKSQGIPVKVFLADWKRDGKSAGPIRNRVMAGYADALIAIWDGKSRGTKHMIDTAVRCGLKVFVKTLDYPKTPKF